jgi:hypothetical protein
MKILYSTLSLLCLMACGGSTSSPPEGPLKMGIVAGNNQISKAGETKFANAVVGRLVRVSTASNSGWHFEFVKTAYAQTVVTGSPVPGAVVCAVSLQVDGMVPFVPCTNTDANGQATFFFAPGTKSGPVESEIRGTLAGQPAVFDTAKAVVTPSDPYEILVTGVPATCMPSCPKYQGGDVLDLHSFIMAVRDKYSNLIVPATSAAVSHSGIDPAYNGFTPQWAVWTGSGEGSPDPTNTGWTVTLPQVSGTVTVWIWVGAAAKTRFQLALK